VIDKNQISSWKVLVVDDEPDSLEVVTRVLVFHGAHVFHAANGKEALTVVEEIHPNLILTDLSMPVMDGWEMLYHLQSNPRTTDIPVVALTAHAMPGDRERAVGAGFHYYLTKPLSPLTFLDDLLKLFAGQPPRAVSTMPLPVAPPKSNGSKNGKQAHDQPKSLSTYPSQAGDPGQMPLVLAAALTESPKEQGQQPVD
jgi:CheY-like chemotaxis protein